MAGEPPANPFSDKKRNSAGGNLRKRQRGRLVGRVRPRRTGGAAQISICLRNGFGFQRKIAPNKLSVLVTGILFSLDIEPENRPFAIAEEVLRNETKDEA